MPPLGDTKYSKEDLEKAAKGVEKIDEIFAIIPKRKVAAKEKLDKLVELITGHCEKERKKETVNVLIKSGSCENLR